MTGPAACVPLFCVPYAGGSARAYRRWQATLGPELELVVIERQHGPAPGAGADTVRQATAGVVRRIGERAGGRPYLLLGHSVGSLIAYEAALLAPEHGLPEPGVLIAAARNPPHVRGRWGPEAVDLPDQELLDRLKAVGGIPSGLSASLASAFFLPRLRGDLRAAVAYTPSYPTRRVNAPLLVMAGRTDPLVMPDRLGGWAGYTARECAVQLHQGGHFALLDQPEELALALRRWTVQEAGGTR